MIKNFDSFWQTYLASLPEDHPHHQATYNAWGFGDSPQMADELGQLVVAGTKAATASLAREYEAEGETIPPVGDVNIILNGADEPICIIETTEITIKPFNQVDAQFAYDEGEGDRSLAYWKNAHERYFTRTCERYDWTFTGDELIVLERFKVIYRP